MDEFAQAHDMALPNGSRTTKNSELTERLRAALTGVPRVEEKRMFGGTAFMVNGKLCITARPGRLMCRIDPELHAHAIRRPGAGHGAHEGTRVQGLCVICLDYNCKARASR
jgi:hypothetical protein